MVTQINFVLWQNIDNFMRHQMEFLRANVNQAKKKKNQFTINRRGSNVHYLKWKTEPNPTKPKGMKLDFMFHLFYSNDVLNLHTHTNTHFFQTNKKNKRTEFSIKKMKSVNLQACWKCNAAFHFPVNKMTAFFWRDKKATHIAWCAQRNKRNGNKIRTFKHLFTSETLQTHL